LFTLAGLALAVLAVLHADLSASQAYRVATVRDMFTHAPRPWVGRTLAVRGRLDECATASPRCPLWQWRLFDVGAGTHISIPVELTPPDSSLLTQLHGLPVLGALIPVPQPKRGAVGTYSVQLAALPTPQCSTLLCAAGDDFNIYGDDFYLIKNTFGVDFYLLTCEKDTCYKVLLLSY
jgi:hypothetical protein